ncbi:tRNA (adenosine(37)-N6)-threonylcarbamoyltransferase complex dimerization subunit type 1 TsaB [Flaviaesturariibacter flavus]|uniref:tRNA (Adenosine(37)-N6)-threonylcarbamoyltransferase complex dimerization subunit type 1 TsaB n=1 Tax=Flaviaesturariibacter flavus TaxID=2502780 RepID=A0A4R1BAX5_9BACT|nr:tRNA (adenosine(37)-N6)-threonylcarbamoyltransferase complex dimerization subunit type 1 TsaB [Flaviaesturariibacter flavus]TCJ14146.1 tRNA (adenosine(37)-N6)-threonylcarbamoyltransferase complex dimerization subunit type 1 TsaB [Flaviaesturariibacter flavus]
MPLLLHIDTAVTGASVCLSDDAQVLAYSANPAQRDSAAWLQAAIRDLMTGAGRRLDELSAVSVSAGPGSYTGLRVGMASAKGLCYALGIPLLTVPTLKMMAAAAAPADGLLCPMIDARRLEVFAAVYNSKLEELVPAAPFILDENSFSAQLDAGPVTFFGNGSAKFRPLLTHPNARFAEVEADARHLAPLASAAFAAGAFADLAYAVPFYGKEFYTPVPPKTG